MSTGTDVNKLKKWEVLARIEGIVYPYGLERNEVIKKNARYWNAVVGEVFQEKLSKRKKLTIFPQLNDKEKKHLLLKLEKSGLNLDDFKNTEISFHNLTLRDFAFEGFVFPAKTIFCNCIFHDQVNFDDSIFLSDAKFEKSTFEGPIGFRSVKFLKGGSFVKCSFRNEAVFDKSYFKLGAVFEEVIFEGAASFYNSTFIKTTYFSVVEFIADVNFSNSKFNGVEFKTSNFGQHSDFSHVNFAQENSIFPNTLNFVDFSGVRFQDTIYFNDSNIGGGIEFSKCEFNGDANFARTKFFGPANFAAAKFLTSLSFREAKFTEAPPYFFDAIVTEDLDISNIELPVCQTAHRDPTHHTSPSTHILAYERLKLLMSKLERDHDKHLFYRKEMQARRAQEGPWFSRSFFSKSFNLVYDLSSNYGYNFERALTLWLGNILLGLLVLFPYTEYTLDISFKGLKVLAIEVFSTFGISFSNSHSFFGLHKGALNNLYSEENSTLFYTVWTLQSVIGAVLLFILLLTIRNRFKIS